MLPGERQMKQSISAQAQGVLADVIWFEVSIRRKSSNGVEFTNSNQVTGYEMRTMDCLFVT
jgi:hypothetical protein